LTETGPQAKLLKYQSLLCCYKAFTDVFTAYYHNNILKLKISAYPVEQRIHLAKEKCGPSFCTMLAITNVMTSWVPSSA
jgi:hypothetical protein